MANNPIYVVDTNVLIDYPDVIPQPNGKQTTVHESSIDLSGAHIVVPSLVVRELSSFKKENSERGKASRLVLRRLEKISRRQKGTMIDIYKLNEPITMAHSSQKISIFPLHKDFKNCLPYCPSEDDMDGQIILAALSVAFLQLGFKIDGTEDPKNCTAVRYDNVVVLTNDNGLAIRARERGLVASRYGYKYPEPYTGRRDLVVPPELFREFYMKRQISRKDWEAAMPEQKPLVANEFIVMSVARQKDYPREFNRANNPQFRHIGRYDKAEDAIVGLSHIQNAPFKILSDGQATYAEALLHPSISAIVCTGPAGSGKTYLPTVYGIDSCKKRKYINIAIVPCADLGNLGALPGSLNQKMSLDTGPFRNAIRDYLLNEDTYFRHIFEEFRRNATPVDYYLRVKDDEKGEKPEMSLGDMLKAQIDLIWQMFFVNIPVGKAQGLSFSYQLICYDEFQDQSPSKADMLMKRLGKQSKMVFTGDIKQIHAPYLDEHNNGIVYVSREFYNDPEVARVSLLAKEVERHGLVKRIAERQEKRQRGR